MKYKRMKTFGIICAILAGLCLVCEYASIVIYTVSIISGNASTQSYPAFFFASMILSLVYSLFFYAAIPLLIVSGIKLRRSRNIQRSALQVPPDYRYCPYCGTSIETKGMFCCSCGRNLCD